MFVFWGETFENLTLQIGEIRSLIPERVIVMTLTATATPMLREKFASIIGLNNEAVNSISPEKSIINSVHGKGVFVCKESFSSLQTTLVKVFDVPKAIVYCRRI